MNADDDDRQMPLPFRHGLRPMTRRARAHARRRGWPYVGGQWAHPCPACGCDRDHPCSVTLEGGAGRGVCLPAGVYGARVCSNCAKDGTP